MRRYLTILSIVFLFFVGVSCEKDPDVPVNQGGVLGGYGSDVEYVDLGLTSGVLWATCNVGANSPEQSGDYYSWGEVSTKSSYSMNNYKYSNGTMSNLTKYNFDSFYGTADNITTLQPQDDAATQNKGSAWRMPTLAEFKELQDECTWLWTELNGVCGYMLTGPNGNCIFLPASGYYCDASKYNENNNGYYWSRDLDSQNPMYARQMSFTWSNTIYLHSNNRYEGRTIRAVRKDGGSTSGTIGGQEYVDLGLPSGLKWAIRNVGAENPEDYGNYYAWGETEPKTDYSSSTYTYSNSPTTLPASADAATVNWGNGWRMPTQTELNELINNCTWQLTTLNGVNGYRVTGTNGNSIFLPAAGSRSGTETLNVGSYGYYWSSSVYNSSGAWYLLFGSDGHSMNYYYGYREGGHSVRAVHE